MGVGYCTIKYELDGREYNTQHSFHTTNTIVVGQSTFTAADAVALGLDTVGVGTFNQVTDPDDEDYGPVTFIERLVAFHRILQGPLVTLTKLYLHDGPTTGTDTGAFATRALNLQCRAGRLSTDPETYAPANVAFLIAKSAASFSAPGGRIWMRGAMLKSEIKLGGSDGVNMTDAGFVANATYLATAIASSGIVDFFGTGTTGADESTPVQYGICQTIPEDPDDPEGTRVINSFSYVSAMSVIGAQSRDTRRRGRRRDDTALRLARAEKRLADKAARVAYRKELAALQAKWTQEPTQAEMLDALSPE